MTDNGSCPLSRLLPLLAALAASPAAMGDDPGGEPGNGQAPAGVAPGPADACKAYPDYALNLGFEGPVFISTNVRGYPGLVLAGRDKTGKRKIYQHPSWTRAGYLAAYTYDEQGNFYVAPSPLVSLWENPPAEQNRIWKIDHQTREMSLFAVLPATAPPSSRNPFGVLGLAYDCDTASLYATSVMGSTPEEEKGRVFRIDLDSAEPEVILEGRDFFGLAVLNSGDAKRLFLGSARTSGVYSVALNTGGRPSSSPDRVLYLSNAPGGANDQVKRILFADRNTMIIKGISFQYTLKVASAYPHSQYVFKRERSEPWRLVSVQRGLVR